jgi:2-(1,2-epoxy-1,2-dihydrophenyl)acetyl-CoA isomerase
MNEPLRIERRGHGVWLILNRPDSGNAIDVHLAQALGAAATALRDDSAARVVVLTGEGALFCAGGDVRAFASGESASDAIDAITSRLHPAIEAFAALPKPILTLVNGSAAGAGLGLALLGDVVLAARTAHFTSAYTAIGLTPDAATSWLLPRLIGLRRAQELILTNRRVSADEAERLGMITRSVDDDELSAEGEKLATQLATSAVGACGAARALLFGSFSHELHEQLAAEARMISSLAGGREGSEGIASFLEKRSPRYLELE